MKTFILVSLSIALAYASSIGAREPQPASFYGNIGEEAKAAILATRSANAGVNLARQYNCDGACILANSDFCDFEGCEESVDANWYVMTVIRSWPFVNLSNSAICCAIHNNNCPDCALGGDYC
jgi:hypothetical protein